MYVIAYRKKGHTAWSFTRNPLTREEAEGVARRYRKCRYDAHEVLLPI
jgi:hypothetical protein